jgi:hypothetical protein
MADMVVDIVRDLGVRNKNVKGPSETSLPAQRSNETTDQPNHPVQPPVHGRRSVCYCSFEAQPAGRSGPPAYVCTLLVIFPLRPPTAPHPIPSACSCAYLASIFPTHPISSIHHPPAPTHPCRQETQLRKCTTSPPTPIRPRNLF